VDGKSLGLIAVRALIVCQVLHQPVVNIPGFQGENGLPIGLSLVAPRFHDRRLLAVSTEVGAIFESDGGWKRRVADSD
jgi:Asp-tRNA(Asn)/Glu-tRNA(Gln) amidotransferase A subunit family amidase